MSGLRYIFVHGLAGWGSYDKKYERLPYWGMRCGDLIGYLWKQGFQAYAASVAPAGSAWDRACELYAQLAGLRTDYGAAHSAENCHERFGRDFSSCPLIPDWRKDTRLVLLGHSFGGTTSRLLSELLAHGDKEEQNSTPPDKLSGLFQGGMGDRVCAIAALASPINGTTAYDLSEDGDFDPRQVKVPLWSRGFAKIMAKGAKPKKDSRKDTDYADHDMHIDNAMALNRRISTFPSVYYFSVPCCSTRKTEHGYSVPDHRKTDPLFVTRSHLMGSYTGKTKAGFVIDEKWQENDGLVNTFSARAPLDAPQTELDPDNIRPGIWNVFPTYSGDHVSLQGGMMRRNDTREFYLSLLTMIEKCLS